MIFNKLHPNVNLSETMSKTNDSATLVCKINDSAMQTQSQGHTLSSWNSAVWGMAVLQTAVLLSLDSPT